MILFAANSAMSQDTLLLWNNPYYFDGGYDIYYQPGPKVFLDVRRNGKACKYYSTENVEVYGVAVTMVMRTGGPVDPTKFYTTLNRLCQDGEYQCLDTGVCGPLIPAAYLTYYSVEGTPGNWDTVNVVVPSYEYYFNETHLVNDSFYVAVRSYKDYLTMLEEGDEDRTNVMVVGELWPFYIDLPEGMFYPWYFIDTSGSLYQEDYGFGGIYPILQPDRPYCNAVGGLRLEERGEDWARFVWDDAGDSVEYQLVFGHDHTHPVNLYDTTYTISGLDSGRYYDVRLRRVCHHDCPYHTDTVVYSAYSAALRFWVGSTDPANMGVEAADADGGLEVYPNPSSGVVTVVVGRPVGGTLEVHDAVGRTVLRSERLEREMRLDLSQLPRGVYTVTLDSPGGIATRRLVLQ